jgi:hypothetical protein
MSSASATNGRCVDSKKRIAKICFDSMDARVKEVSLNHSTLSTKNLAQRRAIVENKIFAVFIPE